MIPKAYFWPASCGRSRLSARLERQATVYFVNRTSCNWLIHQSVDKRKRKFTTVYPFRGGVSKILPARSAASQKHRSRAASTVTSEHLSNEFSVRDWRGLRWHRHFGRHGQICFTAAPNRIPGGNNGVTEFPVDRLPDYSKNVRRGRTRHDGIAALDERVIYM